MLRNNTLKFPPCRSCQSVYVYADGNLFICPECGEQWGSDDVDTDKSAQIKDSNGKPLSNGDSITIIKDLKIKGSSAILKIGTKIKNIRLIEGDHNIDCKVAGFGELKLKSIFVKKI